MPEEEPAPEGLGSVARDSTEAGPEEVADGLPDERSLGALLVGVVAGLLVLAGMLALAILLYQRVYGDSLPALLILLAVFGGLGSYLAWLVGVLVFSSIRRPPEGDSDGDPAGGADPGGEPASG